MVIRACAGVNIVLEGVPMQGIWISSEAGSWYEGPIPHDILVKGNTFKNIWKNSAKVDAVNADNNLVPALKNISFVDNVFYLSETSGNVAVLVSNGEKTSFRGNRYFGKDGAVIPQAEAVKVVPPATVEF